MKNTNNLADIIKEARTSLGISQRELSRETGIDNNTIAQIEKGTRKKPNALSLVKLGEFLNLDTTLLMKVCGYEDKDIESLNGIIKNTTNDDLIKQTESQISNLKDLIKRIEHSMKTHEDPAYKNMSKEDIEFMDQQSKELIEVNKSTLKIYEAQLDILKKNINNK